MPADPKPRKDADGVQFCTKDCPLYRNIGNACPMPQVYVGEKCAVRSLAARCREAEGLIADLRAWCRFTDEDANEEFERIADLFRADTGMLRPGKSQSPECYVPDEERQARWRRWCDERHAALKSRIDALLATPPPPAKGDDGGAT